MKLLIAGAAILLAGCVGQTPQEMAEAAAACKAGGFKVQVLENPWGERKVACGVYVGVPNGR